MNLTEAIATLLISNGIAAGIFYVIGVMHGIEREQNKQRVTEFYRCCDHCYGPDGELTSLHFNSKDPNAPILKMDEHTISCIEPGCIAGRTVGRVIYS